MGWAIRRLDGTYRAWNAFTQDDTLGPGEVWVSLNSLPPISSTPIPAPPNPLKIAIDVVLASTGISPEFRALLMTWKAQL